MTHTPSPAYRLCQYIALNRARGKWKVYDLRTRSTDRTDDYGHVVAEATNRGEAIRAIKDILDGKQSPPGAPIRRRLEYLRAKLRAERISYGELAELQDLAPHIDPSDTELLEAAGVPEFRDEITTLNDLVTMLRIVTADYRSLRAAYFATPQGGDGTCPAVLEAEALIERITNPLT